MENIQTKKSHTTNQQINLNELDPKQLAIIIKKYKNVVIKISASWCGPCKNKKFINDYEQLKSKFLSNPNIIFIELDVDENSKLIESKEYYDIEIESVPTFLISSNGNFSHKFIGAGYLNQMYSILSS